MSWPTVVNYFIILAVTYKKDKMQSRIQAILCSQLFLTSVRLLVAQPNTEERSSPLRNSNLALREAKRSIYLNSEAMSSRFSPFLSSKCSCIQNSPLSGQHRDTCSGDLSGFQRDVQLRVQQQPQQPGPIYGIHPPWLLQYHGGVGRTD